MPLIIGDEHEAILQQLKEKEIIVPGHFELRSGRHSDTYLNKNRFFTETPELFEYFCQRIADDIISVGYQGIVAPAKSGIIVAEKVLELINNQRHSIQLVPATKDNNEFVIDPKDIETLRCRPIVVIEDVMTTGQTAFKVGKLACELGAIFNCVYCLFDRGGAGGTLSRNVYRVMQLTLASWEAPCRLCRNNVPLSPKPSG